MQSRNQLRIDLRKIRQKSDKYHDFWKMCPGASREILHERFAAARIVALYVAVGSEVNPAPLAAGILDLGAGIALPRVSGRDVLMTFHRWSPGAPLERAAFGFQQPFLSAEAVTPDLIIVPLLGFDAKLNRLGQGAGHYDRYFSSNPNSLKIGLAWSSQEVPALEAEPWDVPLDAMLTERGWIDAPGSAKSGP